MPPDIDAISGQLDSYAAATLLSFCSRFSQSSQQYLALS